jgi:hypothetical protein
MATWIITWFEWKMAENEWFGRMMPEGGFWWWVRISLQTSGHIADNGHRGWLGSGPEMVRFRGVRQNGQRTAVDAMT